MRYLCEYINRSMQLRAEKPPKKWAKSEKGDEANTKKIQFIFGDEGGEGIEMGEERGGRKQKKKNKNKKENKQRKWERTHVEKQKQRTATRSVVVVLISWREQLQLPKKHKGSWSLILWRCPKSDFLSMGKRVLRIQGRRAGFPS